MTTLLFVIIAFTYGYLAAVKHADILDKREARKRAKREAKLERDYSNIEAPSILNYDKA